LSLSAKEFSPGKQTSMIRIRPFNIRPFNPSAPSGMILAEALHEILVTNKIFVSFIHGHLPAYRLNFHGTPMAKQSQGTMRHGGAPFD